MWLEKFAVFHFTSQQNCPYCTVLAGALALRIDWEPRCWRRILVHAVCAKVVCPLGTDCPLDLLPTPRSLLSWNCVGVQDDWHLPAPGNVGAEIESRVRSPQLPRVLSQSQSTHKRVPLPVSCETLPKRGLDEPATIPVKITCGRSGHTKKATVDAEP